MGDVNMNKNICPRRRSGWTPERQFDNLDDKPLSGLRHDMRANHRPVRPTCTFRFISRETRNVRSRQFYFPFVMSAALQVRFGPISFFSAEWCDARRASSRSFESSAKYRDWVLKCDLCLMSWFLSYILSVSSPTFHRQWKQAKPSHGLPSSTQLRLCRRKHISLCLGMFLPTTKSLCHCVRHALTLTKLFWTLSNSTSLSLFFVDQITSSFSNLGRLLTFTLQITRPLSKFRLATWGLELTILAVNLKPMEAGSIWKTWPIIWVPNTFLLLLP